MTTDKNEKKYICRRCKKPIKTQKSLEIIGSREYAHTYHKGCWGQFTKNIYIGNLV